jgi:hypothetical protein
MNGISMDVVSILLFAAVVLGQLFMQIYRRRQAARRTPTVAESGNESVMDFEPDDEAQGYAPLAVPAEPVVHHPAYVPLRPVQEKPAPARIRRHSRRVLLGSPRRVQDAVVVATILGRCRAFEPHDPER